MGWNLLPPLVQVLLKKEDKNLPQCLAIFNHLLEVCRPKELLIGLLEQLEQDDPVIIAESLHLLLNPLQKLLLRLGSRKASSIAMTLSSVLDQVSKLPLPHTKEQEEDDVFSLCRCCDDLVTFVRPFIQEARRNLLSGETLNEGSGKMSETMDGVVTDKHELRTELLKFCMRTLSHPLLEVQLKDPDTLPVSPLRNFATEILNSLSAIGESIPSLVHQPLSKRKDLPGFLEEEELYEKSLVRVEDVSLPTELLQIRTFLTVPQRTKGLKVFQLTIDKFGPEAKYNFFSRGNGNSWFEGVHLLPLLRLVFTLPDGPETDLLQYLDRLMEALNLLRYLVIRDKVTENQTGIWTELYRIEDTFVQPLRVGLNMSRAHYEKELSDTVETKKTKAKEKSVASVFVGGDKLPNLTSDSQIQALHSALHTFDMMESVLVRIEELIEVKNNV
ncbi:unnamed protein product [Lampetra planeri]